MNTNDSAFLTDVLDLLLDVVCVVNTAGRFVFVSGACERVFGYAADEMIGQPMIDFVFPADRPRTLNAVDEIVAGTHKPHFENRYLRKDGQIVHIMWSAQWSPVRQMRVAVARDVTERKRAESMRAALHAVSEAAFAARDLVALFQRVHHIIGELLPAANFFVALYDETTAELSFPYHADDGFKVLAPRPLDSDTLSAEVIRTGRALLRTSDAEAALPARVQLDVGPDSLAWLGVPLKTQKKGVIGALVVQSYSPEVHYAERDVELLEFVCAQVAAAIERKQIEAWLLHASQHDALTGLPNRERLQERMRAALDGPRGHAAPFALLYLDLDMFKQVNDRLGHAAGDLLLQQTARRLEACMRGSDTVGRVGGDEFLVLLDSPAAPQQALEMAERILAALGRPFDLGGEVVSVSPSIGVALWPEHGDDPTRLIRHADEAMYRAKREGGNGFRLAASAPGS
ncbi:diguanylate cyclase domain-containing protein [Variovorax sp. PBL-E5]|uniref:diguanylate cyclase domain-containing protein n=1 Tax=Variovorax sp. PBL-E5 TaxID=434014 RepID=UPI0013160890|nr:diguanylate cyclase [Variovorax sp. PBL-E5]VTU40028.1 Cyclic di-GMP phosphodiesterase Gmr [Variovorax sp. PBL-E5]